MMGDDLEHGYRDGGGERNIGMKAETGEKGLGSFIFQHMLLDTIHGEN